jgi:hypothetical protein
MSLGAKITDEMKQAMRAKQTDRLAAIRMLKNAIANKEKELKRELTDEEIISLVVSDVKKRKDSIEQFAKGGREDLVLAESAGISFLEGYLPEQMSEEKVRQIVSAAVAATGATAMKDMGAVMKEVMPQVKGKADGGLVNQIVKEALSS